MKLKEKMAEDWLVGFKTEDSLKKIIKEMLSNAYLAGFEKAREMAKDLVKTEGLDIDVLISLMDLGEEEV